MDHTYDPWKYHEKRKREKSLKLKRFMVCKAISFYCSTCECLLVKDFALKISKQFDKQSINNRA